MIDEAILSLRENAGEAELLESITAYDQRDGDVTETLIVERMMIKEDGENAVIVFVAKDRSNNVTKKEMTIPYIQGSSEDKETANIEKSIQMPTDEDDLMINTDTTPLQSTGVPVIRLKQYRAIINAGDVFDALSYVASAVDDKDYASTRIQVEGEYDSYTPGTYELKYYVIDSDGNQSNIEVLMLEVR